MKFNFPIQRVNRSLMDKDLVSLGCNGNVKDFIIKFIIFNSTIMSKAKNIKPTVIQVLRF